MSSASINSTPAEVPGPSGGILGLLRDTTALLIYPGWKAFFERRRQQYGNVFRCHAFFESVAILDADGFEPLINWDGRLAKEYGFGWAKPPRPLVGDTTPGMFSAGAPHDVPKRIYLELLREGHGSMVKTFAAVSSEYFGRWEESGKPFCWKDQIENFYSDFFFQWLLGARPDPDDVRVVYQKLFKHSFGWRIAQYFPGRFRRQMLAYDRLLNFVKAAPGFVNVRRIAQTAGMDDEDELARQLLFTLGVNCYLGLQSFTKSAVGELSLDLPKFGLRAEIQSALGGKPLVEWQTSEVDSVPGLDQFVREVLRLHPAVFYIFGRAQRDFTLPTAEASFRIRQGDRLMGMIAMTQRDPARYSNPDSFDPDRFKQPAAATGLVWPHGPHSGAITATDRICAGRDVALTIAKLFVAKLVLDYEWRLVRPGVRWSDRRLALNIAAPIGKLEVASFARHDGATIRWGPRSTWFQRQRFAVYEKLLAPIGVRLLKSRFVQWMLKENLVIRRLLSQFAIDFKTSRTAPRPYQYSLWTPGDAASPPAKPYTSWTSLSDRRFTSRHLPPAAVDYNDRLPDVDRVAELFTRCDVTVPCPTSSALFGFFAQWFTDSFLRTHPVDKRLNTSNHDIDLCQIYGLDAATTAILRENRGGRLRMRRVGNSEYPEQLFDDYGHVKFGFGNLPHMARTQQGNPPHERIVEKLFNRAQMPASERQSRYRTLYASGLERGNTTIVYSAINTVFMREHNRICAELHLIHPLWDDDRLFETARCVNIVLLLKLIVEDYINHLSDAPFHFVFDHSFASRKRWYRTNRIALEFDLLYRWHSQVPSTLLLDGRPLDETAYMYNNPLLESIGVENLLTQASRQSAGRICIGNTPNFLLSAEKAALNFARTQRTRPYNEYRERFKMLPCKSFEALVGPSGDRQLVESLRSLYGHVDNVELVTGLFAEKHSGNGSLGDLMRTMVAVDAFSHALTSPVLADNIFNLDTFSERGMSIIEDTSSFQDIVRRNSPDCLGEGVIASFRKI